MDSKRDSILARVVRYVVLPKEITPFEERYLDRLNRVALIFFLLHFPVFVLIAAVNDTGWTDAIWLTALVLAGPTIAYKTLKNPRTKTTVFGITAMLMGGLLVHFGQGPVQIEMHFYFFVLLALLAVFANPNSIIAAAVTVALHHAVLWVVLPSSVFNYDAPLWVVGVHALFVVLESTAAVFVARNYFDNVIGLERIVQARTVQIAERTAAMQLVLDSVGQGFMTMNREGELSKERSKILGDWFEGSESARTFEELLCPVSPKTAEWFAIGWEGVVDGFMPLEVCLAQLPSGFSHGERHFEIEYRAIQLTGAEELERMLVVISDVTAQKNQELAEELQRETLALFERVVSDRNGVLEFFEEASELVRNIRSEHGATEADLARWIHTLKGNAMLYGLSSVATLCHDVESRWQDEHEQPSREAREAIGAHWDATVERMRGFLGEGRTHLELDADDYAAIQDAIDRRASYGELRTMVTSWSHENMRRRLERVAEQARAVARRLGKGEIDVVLEPNGVRLPADEFSRFWSAFTHVVRNALDHGIEVPEDRAESGKPDRGRLALRTVVEQRSLVVSLSDDGRGIDWDGIAKKAAELGLPTETPEDLERALFAEGMTTKPYATEYSGRGVGMGAVLAVCRAMGGEIEVESRAGRGTTMRFVMPVAGAQEQSRSHPPVARSA